VIFGAFVLGWALALGGVHLTAIRRLWTRRPPTASTPIHARVLVIRPCAGADPWLPEALASLSEARRSFDVSCRVAIASAEDRARDAAEGATGVLAARGIDARVAITSPRGPNRKAAQLARVVEDEGARFDVVIVADADVDLAGMDLDALVAPLIARPDLAATWAPPIEVAPPRTLGDRASAAVLGASLHAFPVLSKLDRAGLVGKLFAVRRDALLAVGGFGALVNHLGEDMELARRLRAHGFEVEAAPVLARSLSSGRALGDVEARFSRWIQVIRAQRPLLLASYPLIFFATIPLVIAAAIAAMEAPLFAAIAAAYAILTRLALALAASFVAGRGVSLRRAIADAVLADLVLARAFVGALGSRSVVWRDVPLRIDRGGALRLAEKGS
jgi:ceramide glucosyltransferase